MPKSLLNQPSSEIASVKITHGMIQYFDKNNAIGNGKKWSNPLDKCTTNTSNGIVSVNCRMWHLNKKKLQSSATTLFETSHQLRLAYRHNKKEKSLLIGEWFPYRNRFACSDHNISQLEAVVSNDSVGLTWQENGNNKEFEFMVVMRRVEMHVRKEGEWRRFVLLKLEPPLTKDQTGMHTVHDLRECTTYKACVETQYNLDETKPRKTYRTCTQEFTTLGCVDSIASSKPQPEGATSDKITFAVLGLILAIIFVMAILLVRNRSELAERIHQITSQINGESRASLVSQRRVQGLVVPRVDEHVGPDGGLHGGRPPYDAQISLMSNQSQLTEGFMGEEVRAYELMEGEEDFYAYS